MNRRRNWSLLTISVLLVLTAACGRTEPASVTLTGAAGEGARGGPPGSVNLAQLAADCASSAQLADDGIGVVAITGDLWAANETVSIDDPCLVALSATSQVRLNNVQLHGATLNIDDRGAEAGPNRIQLQHVQLSGDADAGLLISLSDADDSVRIEASTIDYEGGISIAALGTRDDANTGGEIALVGSDLTASAADGVGIWLSASEHDGSFTAVNTVAESPAGVTVVAGTCTITRQGKPVDCSTSTVADDLAAQAQEALTE